MLASASGGWGSGAPAAPPRACVLCRAPAALYCRNDDAFLCSSCDLQVHGCSALLAGHDRMPCAALGGAAGSCDSGSAATAAPLDAAFRAQFPDLPAALPSGTAEAVLVAAAAEAAAQRHASWGAPSAAAPALSPSPFALLSKLQPPPALPHLAGGAPAASDETRWDDRAALGRVGSLDAMLMECLEGLIAGNQAHFDSLADPPAGMAQAPPGPLRASGEGPSHSSCSSGGDGGPPPAAAAAAGDPFQHHLLQTATAALAATVAAATAGTLSSGGATALPPPRAQHASTAAAVRPAAAGGGWAVAAAGPPGAPPHLWAPVITTGMGGRAGSCGLPTPCAAAAAHEPPAAALWPQGSATLPSPPAPTLPPPPAHLRRCTSAAALPPPMARLESGGSTGVAPAVTTGAAAEQGASLAAADAAKATAAAAAAPDSAPALRRTSRASAAAAAAKTAAMAAAEAEPESGGRRQPAAAAAAPGERDSSGGGGGGGGGIVAPPYREGESRADKLARYRAKKLRRKFDPTVRYQCRKHYADLRPRIRGRFVSPEEFAAWREQRGACPPPDAAPDAC